MIILMKIREIILQMWERAKKSFVSVFMFFLQCEFYVRPISFTMKMEEKSRWNLIGIWIKFHLSHRCNLYELDNKNKNKDKFFNTLALTTRIVFNFQYPIRSMLEFRSRVSTLVLLPIARSFVQLHRSFMPLQPKLWYWYFSPMPVSTSPPSPFSPSLHPAVQRS